MKVTVNSVTDFVSEIIRVPHVYQDAVRCFVDRTAKQKEQISFDVTLVLTAICEEGNGTEYLLEFVQYCGVDNSQAEQFGSMEMQRLKSKLTDTLPGHIAIRPGRLEA